MKRLRQAGAVIALMASVATPAAAEVLNATYRGTLVCEKLPFIGTNLREAIEVIVADGAVKYREVVRVSNTRSTPEPEQGAGSLSGQHIELQGSWKQADRRYEAKYSGDFVRRSAHLKGTQTWTVGDKTVTRNCAGAIKRPFKPFLPRNKK